MKPVGRDGRHPEKRPGLLPLAAGRMGLRGQMRSRVLSSGRDLGLSALHGTLRVQKETPELEPCSGCASRGSRRTRHEEWALRAAPQVSDASRHRGDAVRLWAGRVPSRETPRQRHPGGPRAAHAGHVLSTSAPGPRAALRAGGAQHGPREVGSGGGAQPGPPQRPRSQLPAHQSMPETLPPRTTPKAPDGGSVAGPAHWPSHSEGAAGARCPRRQLACRSQGKRQRRDRAGPRRPAPRGRSRTRKQGAGVEKASGRAAGAACRGGGPGHSQCACGEPGQLTLSLPAPDTPPVK